jgi:hypothetical protein
MMAIDGAAACMVSRAFVWQELEADQAEAGSGDNLGFTAFTIAVGQE